MDGFRATFNPDGTESSRSHDEASREQKAPTRDPAAHQGGVAYRTTTNPTTGEIEVTRSVAKGTNVNVTPPTHEASAMNAQGQMVDLSRASAKDVVNVPGWGTSSAEAFVTMNVLRPNPNGQGYLLVGALPSVTPPAPPPPSAPAAKSDTVQPGDGVGIPATSADVDSFQVQLATKTPMAFEGALTTIVKGGIPDWASIAEQHGAETATFEAQGTRLHQQYLASGQKALSNIGVTNFEGFEAWSREVHPDRADSAVRDLVSNKSVAALQKLGREYVEHSNTQIYNQILGAGAEAIMRDGKVFVSRADLGLGPSRKSGDFGGDLYMSAAEAFRLGYLTFNAE